MEENRMARPSIDKEAVGQEAFCIACEQGLSSVSIRDVAAACGVSVGSIYNHYPSKEDLLTEVVARFWREALETTMCKPEEGECFVDYVERVYAVMKQALAQFRSDWLPEVRAVGTQSNAAFAERERQVMNHIRAGLLLVLVHDSHTHVHQLGDITEEQLCCFCLDSMMASLSVGAENCTVLLALLRTALYEREG